MKSVVFFFLAAKIAEGFVPPPSSEESYSALSSSDQHVEEQEQLPFFIDGEEDENKKFKLNLIRKTFVAKSTSRPPQPTFNVTHKVFFDIHQGDKNLGRIVFGLFGEVAPKTVENFRQIATVGINGKTYAGTKIIRIINKILIRGGDIVNDDGSGDISIYGPTFKDETRAVKFWAPGYLAMANHGPNTNGCQFYITTTATSWLDDVYVGFGKVIAGLGTVVRIEKTETTERGIPEVPIKIVKCGEMPLDAPPGL